MNRLLPVVTASASLVLLASACGDDGREAVGAGSDTSRPMLDTGGLWVGDRADVITDAPWLGDDGAPIHELVPDYVPVCDAAAGCDAIVGFADALDVYTDLVPLGDPRVSALGYQPGPMPIVDEYGDLVGHMVPDKGFEPLDD